MLVVTGKIYANYVSDRSLI